MNQTIVTVCGDPGGAAALAPVIKALASQSIDTICFTYGPGARILERHGVPFTAIEDTFSPSRPAEILRETKAAALLCATSHNRFNWEKAFIKAAASLSLPSVAVLDFWSNYRERFSDTGTDLRFLPSLIAVMDETALMQMIELGFPKESLVVTGQPAFEDIDQETGVEHDDKVVAERAKFRSRHGIPESHKLVLFVSQPLHAFTAGKMGFDEFDVLDALLPALGHAAEIEKAQVTLVIRPHPREVVTDYEWVKSATNKYGGGKCLHVMVVDDDHGRKWLRAADLVTGMNTALLVDSCLLGRPTLSLQPGLQGADPLPTNKWGASYAVLERGKIASVVKDALFDDRFRLELFAATKKFSERLPKMAAMNIVNQLVQTMRKWEKK